MYLQLADQSIRYPAGIAEDIPVRIREFFVPVDFVVLDMEVDTKTPLILGRPFLSTANANIDVGAGEIYLNINGKEEKFAFKPRVEKCSKVCESSIQNFSNLEQVKMAGASSESPTPESDDDKNH